MVFVVLSLDVGLLQLYFTWLSFTYQAVLSLEQREAFNGVRILVTYKKDVTVRVNLILTALHIVEVVFAVTAKKVKPEQNGR